MKNPPQVTEVDIASDLTFEPLSKVNWNKFVQLFGARGACGNCWCMYFRLNKQEFAAGKQDNGNKESMKELVWANMPTGVLGIYEGQAVAWCAFAPREAYIKLEKSRVHKRIDDEAVWSIICFFIDKQFRRIGVSVAMLNGVIDIARKQKVKIIEAYPTIPTQDKLPDVFAWIGLYKSFERAGFKIADNKSKSRPMVRYYIDQI